MKMSYKRVLVLASHTDDAELGAGGTLARLVEEGAEVHVVAFSTAVESVPEGMPEDAIKREFFQGYILPTKFGHDKRRAHLATMVCSGQINREDALEEMEKPPYPKEMLAEDMPFVIKKLGLTDEAFQEIMAQPPKSFANYPNNYFWIKNMRGFMAFAKRRATGG